VGGSVNEKWDSPQAREENQIKNLRALGVLRGQGFTNVRLPCENASMTPEANNG
jgi:hypothetical protein